MTIEEQAKVYSGLGQTLESNNLLDNSARYMANCGFRDGAKWMLEKAVEWFKNQEETGIPWLDDYEIRLFRKAMEE